MLIVIVSNIILTLTYQLANPGDKMMIPDFMLFAKLPSAIKYKVFFVEVKRKGNYNNNCLQNDVIKLEKEVHLALNKLVHKKVGTQKLLVEDHQAVT